MALVLAVAVGAAIVLTSKKIHSRKKKKRALKAQKALQDSLHEGKATIDNATVHRHIDDLPAYHTESLPPYYAVDRRPMPRIDKQSMG